MLTLILGVLALGALRVARAPLRARAAHVIVVLAQRGAREPHAVHVEPLVAAAVALHPVHFACGRGQFISIIKLGSSIF